MRDVRQDASRKHSSPAVARSAAHLEWARDVDRHPQLIQIGEVCCRRDVSEVWARGVSGVQARSERDVGEACGKGSTSSRVMFNVRFASEALVRQYWSLESAVACGCAITVLVN